MRFALFFTVLLMLSGCDWLKEDFDRITSDQLNQMKCEWQNPHQSRWFYAGTKAGYHLLIHRDLPGDKYYEIKETDLKIDKPKHVSTNEANWVIMPWGPTYDECKK